MSMGDASERPAEQDEATGRAIPKGHPSLSGEEVALLYHVGRRTVREWAKAGNLEWFRGVNGQRRYPLAQFADVLDRLKGGQ